MEVSVSAWWDVLKMCFNLVESPFRTTLLFLCPFLSQTISWLPQRECAYWGRTRFLKKSHVNFKHILVVKPVLQSIKNIPINQGILLCPLLMCMLQKCQWALTSKYQFQKVSFRISKYHIFSLQMHQKIFPPIVSVIGTKLPFHSLVASHEVMQIQIQCTGPIFSTVLKTFSFCLELISSFKQQDFLIVKIVQH